MKVPLGCQKNRLEKKTKLLHNEQN
jgi:hypothetical protein